MSPLKRIYFCILLLNIASILILSLSKAFTEKDNLIARLISHYLIASEASTTTSGSIEGVHPGMIEGLKRGARDYMREVTSVAYVPNNSRLCNLSLTRHSSPVGRYFEALSENRSRPLTPFIENFEENNAKFSSFLEFFC